VSNHKDDPTGSSNLRGFSLDTRRSPTNAVFKAALVSVQIGLTNAAAIAQVIDFPSLCGGGGEATINTIIEGCTKVIEAGPDGPQLAVGYNNRALAYRYAKDYDRAIQDYNDAVRLKPTWAVPYNNRGVTYSRKGEYDKAIDDYTHAMGLDSNYPAPIYNRAVAQLQRGRPELALPDFESVLSFNASNAMALYGRGVAKMKIGNVTGGTADMNAAQQLDPNVQAEFDPGG
jgi:tetratricopeptide (TPR) repeat protein